MYPVIFVHGIGDSSAAWKKTGPFISKYYDCYYITFKNHFGNPLDQAKELETFINNTLKRTNSEKISLVCHSMGGLVARKYLADHLTDHSISKLVLIATPNLGSPGLLYDGVCLLAVILGFLAAFLFSDPAYLILCLAGIIWFLFSFLRGNLLLSPANLSMRPNSSFLKDLNSRPLPTNVKYAAVISKSSDLISRFSELLLNIKEGDGAIPLKSQKLSEHCVPNFRELDYRESLIHLPHYKETGAKEDILKALKL